MARPRVPGSAIPWWAELKSGSPFVKATGLRRERRADSGEPCQPRSRSSGSAPSQTDQCAVGEIGRLDLNECAGAGAGTGWESMRRGGSPASPPSPAEQDLDGFGRDSRYHSGPARRKDRFASREPWLGDTPSVRRHPTRDRGDGSERKGESGDQPARSGLRHVTRAPEVDAFDGFPPRRRWPRRLGQSITGELGDRPLPTSRLRSRYKSGTTWDRPRSRHADSPRAFWVARGPVSSSLEAISAACRHWCFH